MKNLAPILNLLLAIALVFVSIKMVTDKQAQKEADDMNNKTNQTMETILNRSSIRSYTTQEVEEDKIETLLRAAMAAPSAANKQPWAFIVVNERDLLDSLAMELPYAKMLAEAPVAIVVCGDLNKTLLDADQAYWVQDCSAATQNLLLAAHSMGLGAVWTGVFPRTERVDFVRNVLQIPSNLVPLNVIPIGYPNQENSPKDKWNPDNIFYNKM